MIYGNRNGINFAFGGVSVVFLREIPILWKYHLHARVISWSTKWLYIQGVFTLPSTTGPNKTLPSLPPMINNLAADSGMSGTSSPVGVSSMTDSGETICAVIYGRYCFKRKTRETVPVNEVLRICGYTIDKDLEKRRVDGWKYVKGLEHDWDKERALQSTVGL
jgi:hypothetical protein